MTTTTNLSAEALDYFKRLAKDACNWGGSPLVGGNVKQGPAENGYLTALKKANLVTTSESDGDMFVRFSDLGVELANEHGINID